MSKSKKLSIRSNKDHSASSVFRPENLLREARRQKAIPECDIPKVCVLDPDGDTLDYLKRTNRASIDPCWPGYHSQMYQFNESGTDIGIIGRAVGAPFAVLLAEQLFVSGCKLLISITSAGTIKQPLEGGRFVLIEEALRDEGTSYHYLPPNEPAVLDPELLACLQPLVNQPKNDIVAGKSWTTDAPFRESRETIKLAKQQEVMAVEMEAAALYAFAKARDKSVICFAHLTNTMAQQGNDFEKGEENGSIAFLNIIARTVSHLGTVL